MAPLKIDLGKNGFNAVLKSYQIEIMKYLWAFAPGPVTSRVLTIEPADQSGDAFTVEFVTRGWHFQCFTNDNVGDPAYTVRYTAKVTHVD